MRSERHGLFADLSGQIHPCNSLTSAFDLLDGCAASLIGCDKAFYDVQFFFSDKPDNLNDSRLSSSADEEGPGDLKSTFSRGQPFKPKQVLIV